MSLFMSEIITPARSSSGDRCRPTDTALAAAVVEEIERVTILWRGHRALRNAPNNPGWASYPLESRTGARHGSRQASLMWTPGRLRRRDRRGQLRTM